MTEQGEKVLMVNREAGYEFISKAVEFISKAVESRECRINSLVQT